MEDEEIKYLSTVLDTRTMALMERESDLADRLEEIASQQEELTAAIEEVVDKNKMLLKTLRSLEERNQELDQILYRISHDLRSPITSINGVLNVLEYEPRTDTQQICIDHIRDKSSQMDELLKSLSILAKTNSNDVHYAETPIEQLVRDCISDLRFVPNFSAVVIRTESVGNKMIFTDRLLISIVIKALLANALNFRAPSQDGFVLIKTKVEDSFFEIEIVDDGEGISDLIKGQIFNMFYRGSERSTGSGLGLYVARKISEQLKGVINFNSTNGIATFKLVVPSSDIAK
ncbi:MAG: sensor histidine kinase [Cyclobacteriaceae bacterium]